MDVEAMRREAEAPGLATRADGPAVAADLADAFTDDVAFDWMLRTDAKRTAARLRFFNMIVSLGQAAGGRIERPAGGGAAAVWLPFEAAGPLPLMTELRALPTLLNTTGLGRFGRLAAIRADLDKHHPMDRRHTYLWFLGVTHVAQGHGVGSRLLKVATDRLDQAGEPAYLETQNERNVGLYRRHGFEIISEHRCRADAPLMWSMWREPLPVRS